MPIARNYGDQVNWRVPRDQLQRFKKRVSQYQIKRGSGESDMPYSWVMSALIEMAASPKFDLETLMPKIIKRFVNTERGEKILRPAPKKPRRRPETLPAGQEVDKLAEV